MKETEKWEELLQKMEQKNRRSRRWLILAIGLPSALILWFLFQNQNEKAEVAQQLVAVETIRESLQDSAKMREALDLRLKELTFQYMEVLRQKNSDSLQHFYADTLEAYYINVTNGTRASVKAAEDFWFKRAPRELVALDSLDIVQTKDRYTAYANIRYSKDSTKTPLTPMFMVIKYNPDFKIDFVKSYKNEVRSN